MQNFAQAVEARTFVYRFSSRPTPDSLSHSEEFVCRSPSDRNIFLRTAIDEGISALFGRFELDRPAIVHAQPGSRLILTFHLAGDVAGHAIGQNADALDLRVGHAQLRAPNRRGGFLVRLPRGASALLQVKLTTGAFVRVARELGLDPGRVGPQILTAHDGRILSNQPWSDREQAILDNFEPWEASDQLMLRALAGRGAELACAFLRHLFRSGLIGAPESLEHALGGETSRTVPTRLKVLENETGRARSTLWRASKARHGDSPARIMRRRRLDQARAELETTERSVTDIAFDAGWACPSKFAAAFRQRFGLSPSGARRVAVAQRKT